MKKLEDIVHKDGNVYNRIMREDNVALYDVFRDDIFLGFTVFIVKEQKETTMKMKNNGVMVDVKLEHKEVFPGESKYGTSAWFLGKIPIDKAQEKFHDLVMKEKTKKEKKEHTDDNT